MKLTRIDQSTLQTLYSNRNEPDAYRWFRQHAPLHWDDHLEWFQKQRKDSRIEMFNAFANIDSDGGYTNTHVGCVGLTSIDMINKNAEFSCYIFKPYQGNSFCEAALTELFNFGFREMGLNKIWGETFEGNPALRVFIEKLRMEPEGIRKEHYFRNGRFHDAHLIAILRSQWLADA